MIKHEEEFLKQEVVLQEVLMTLDFKREDDIRLLFNNYTEEHEKQAVIEAAQVLGYLELSIELIEK